MFVENCEGSPKVKEKVRDCVVDELECDFLHLFVEVHCRTGIATNCS